MAKKPTYEQLKQKVKKLEKEAIKRKRAEEMLQEERNKLQAVVGAIEYGLTIHDRDYNIIYQNKVLRNTFGRLGEKCYRVYEGKDKICDRCPVQMAWADGKSHTSERKVVMPSGEIAFWENTANPIRDASGEIVACLEIARNITERKRSEEALKESEEKYKTLVDSSLTGVFIHQDEQYVFVNDRFAEMHGYKPEELLKKEYLELIHPDDREALKQTASKRLKGEAVPQQYEVRRLKKDGATIWCEMMATRIEYAGRPAVMGNVIDITERKRSEEALVQAKEDWENTFDAITDMVMLLDNEHQIFRVNKAVAEALNTTKESLVGKKCYEAIHGRSRPIRRCPLMQTMKTLEPHTTEITLSNLGRTFICSTSPILNHEGKLTGYTHTLKDITDSKRLEAQFQQAQRMEAIGTLAGGIAHDFNNLLMGIQGYVSLMLVDIDSTHPYYKRLKNIESQVQSGAQLASNLLGYARKGRYEVKLLNLNQLVKETSDTLGRTRKDITIHRELAKDLFAVKADQGQIEQILFNLYVNAADAMPGGGNLVLKTMNTSHKDMKGKLYDPKPGDYVLLTVTDTGIGMSKKTMERIFDPFFTTKEKGRGTGLGLASAYGIIKSHGGYIDVESKRRQGTTFSVYLPASEKKVRKVVKVAERFTKGTGTVLLVDDEEVILEVGRELLETMGYRVLIAKNGKEAVRVYRKNQDDIDIVLLDMVMPNMGGGEAYDRMKEINPDIKALLSSGFSIDGEASEILERGCNGFIQKPFTMKELSGKIREILDKK